MGQEVGEQPVPLRRRSSAAGQGVDLPERQGQEFDALVALDLVVAFLVQQDDLRGRELSGPGLARVTRLDQATSGGADPSCDRLRPALAAGPARSGAPGPPVRVRNPARRTAGSRTFRPRLPSWERRRGAAAVPPPPGCGLPARPCANPPGGRAGRSAPSRGWGNRAAAPSLPACRGRDARPTARPGRRPRWGVRPGGGPARTSSWRCGSRRRSGARPPRPGTGPGAPPPGSGAAPARPASVVHAAVLDALEGLPVERIQPGRPVRLPERRAAVLLQLVRRQLGQRHRLVAGTLGGGLLAEEEVSAAP